MGKFWRRSKIKDFIQGRIDKLTQFLTKIIEADVYLKADNNHVNENKRCRDSRIFHNDLFTKKRRKNFEAASDEGTELHSEDRSKSVKKKD